MGCKESEVQILSPRSFRKDVRELRKYPEIARDTIMDGAWRSLVARLLREQEVGGSNPLAPILSDRLMAIAGEYGTLSELALALAKGRRVIGLGA